MQLCECEFCVFELTFVSLCLFVCKSVFVCVCGEWGRTLKERSTAGGHS